MTVRSCTATAEVSEALIHFYSEHGSCHLSLRSPKASQLQRFLASSVPRSVYNEQNHNGDQHRTGYSLKQGGRRRISLLELCSSPQVFSVHMDTWCCEQAITSPPAVPWGCTACVPAAELGYDLTTSSRSSLTPSTVSEM